MHNLLLHPLPASDIRQRLAAAKPAPALPPFSSPRWKEIAQNPPIAEWLRQIREKAEAEIGRPLPELTDDLYSECHRTGYRLGFEQVYFERRRRLDHAAVTYLFAQATGDTATAARFESSFLEKLADVFHEVSWAVPAHVRGHPSGKDPRMIDLFAAETANLMAEILHVFGPAIPADLQKAIRERLREDIFENYLDPSDRFVWLTKTNNWNAVCHQGILGAALTIEEDLDLIARLLEKATRFLPHFLEGFTADGGCSEGPAYWEYGFGWFAVLNEQLEGRSGGALSLVHDNPLIPAIARYGPQMILEGDYQVNFADCPPQKVIRPSLFQYLGERFHEPTLLTQARQNYRRTAQNGLALGSNRADLFFLLRHFLFCPENLTEENGPEKGDLFLPELEVMVARGRSRDGRFFEFAAKAGNNGEHHNHNDCGSFLLHVDGEPLIMEIGSPEYDRDFFGPKRYEYLAARTLGHSLPIINGAEQAPGEEFVSQILTAECGGPIVRFSVDLTRSYPAASDCQHCRRDLTFHKETGVLKVADRFELTRFESLETAVITRASLQEENERVILTTEKNAFELVPGAGTVLAGIQTHPFSDHQGNPDQIHRIVFTPENIGETAITLNYELRPLPPAPNQT